MARDRIKRVYNVVSIHPKMAEDERQAREKEICEKIAVCLIARHKNGSLFSNTNYRLNH